MAAHPQQGKQQGGKKAPEERAWQGAGAAQQALYPRPGAVVGQGGHARRRAHEVVDVHGPDGPRLQPLLEV